MRAGHTGRGRGRDGPGRPDQQARTQPQRGAAHLQQRRHRRTKAHQTAANRVRAARRRDAAEDTGGDHPVGQPGGARQGVWAPARQAHHGHLVDAERVGDGPQIVGERQDGFVLMRRRGADAGPIDANQTNIVVLGVDPGFGRDLPPGPWGAMQPEDRTTLRGAELGEADPAVLADGDVSFQFRTGNSDGHGE